MEQFVAAAAAALIGGLFGSCGIAYFFKRAVEKRLQVAENKQTKRKECEMLRYKFTDEYNHAIGRVIFWIIHGTKKIDPEHKCFNGELQKSFEEMCEAEKNIKKLDLDIRAEYEIGE